MRSSSNSLSLSQKGKQENSQSHVATNLSPVAGKMSRNYSLSSLISSTSASKRNFEEKNNFPECTTFYNGSYFTKKQKLSTPSESNQSVQVESTVVPSGGSFQISSQNEMQGTFLFPRPSQKLSENSKSKGKKNKPSSILDFKSIFQKRLGPNKEEQQDDNFTRASQHSLPKSIPVSSDSTSSNVESQWAGNSQWTSSENNLSGINVCPPVRKGSEDVETKNLRKKSFFHFFEINWNEKSPDHRKEISRLDVMPRYATHSRRLMQL